MGTGIGLILCCDVVDILKSEAYSGFGLFLLYFNDYVHFRY